MIFNSLEFLIFLPTIFLLYWHVFKTPTWQNIFIIAASYLFYGWWDWKFLILIALTSLCSYISGNLIGLSQKHTTNFNWGKLVLITNLLINLGILGFFKYYNFFVSNLVSAFNSININLNFDTLDIILPVGISFYTFQALSYSIDVYRKDIQPTKDIFSFFAFISFFPQLVAGPIERATNLLPQFQKERHFDRTKATDGLRQILWGFFKKVAVADACAIIVNNIFAQYASLGGWDLLWGGILFTIQIYCDFSGYSDIAIGTGRLFGINLCRNFNFPFFSRNIAEFWRRWHISLTTWFRDYIYIPMGGSRCSKWKILRNTMVLFLVSGLWHGANWTFVTWGLFHALLFTPLILLCLNRKYVSTVAEGRIMPNVKELLQITSTFFFVVIGFIIFRAENISDAANYLVRMASESTFSPDFFNKHIIAFIAIMFTIEWWQRNSQHALQFCASIKSRLIRYSIYYALIIACLWYGESGVQFIYFQF